MQKRSRHDRGLALHNVPRPEPALVPLLTALGPVVYAVRAADGLIKIGFTSNLGIRHRQIGSDLRSILAWRPGTLEDEQAIHSSLSGLAARGREWYPELPEVLAVVNAMRTEMGIEPLAA